MLTARSRLLKKTGNVRDRAGSLTARLPQGSSGRRTQWGGIEEKVQPRKKELFNKDFQWNSLRKQELSLVNTMGHVDRWKEGMSEFATNIYRSKCRDIGVFPSLARETRFIERVLSMSKTGEFRLKKCG